MSDLILVATLGSNIEPLLHSIKRHEPDTVLIATPDELGAYEGEIVDQSSIGPEQITSLLLRDENDPVAMADRISDYFIQEVDLDNVEIIADFTGGRKPIPAGLVLFAQEFENVELGLMTSLGTEDELTERHYTWRSISFDRVKLKMNVRQAQDALENYRFDEMHSRLKNAAELRNLSTGERETLRALVQVSIGYDYWDRGLFREAHSILRQDSTGPFARERNNYLDHLVTIRKKLDPSSEETVASDQSINNQYGPDPFLLAHEFVQSAQRRRKQERLDEAVARLYRAIEMISQTALTLETGKYTSAFPVDKIPDTIELDKQPDNGTIKLPLEDSFNVFAERQRGTESELARFWLDNRGRILDWIGHRNFSLLAHGFRPIKDKSVIDEGLELCGELMDVARGDYAEDEQFQSVKPDLDRSLICYLNQQS